MNVFDLNASNTEHCKVSDLTHKDLGRTVLVESHSGSNMVAGELLGFQFANFHNSEKHGREFLSVLTVGAYEVPVKADTDVLLKKV